MTIDEQIAALDELINYIQIELPKFAEQVAANDLAALVTNRVVQRGENYQGGQFSAYSTKTVAAYRFWGKSRTQAAERRVRAASRSKTSLSYQTFREINNLNTSPKNFEFTGEMWRKFGIVRSVLGPVFKISLGGTTKAAQDKIDANSQQEGISIIENNPQEELAVQNAISEWLTRQTDRILNA